MPEDDDVRLATSADESPEAGTADSSADGPEDDAREDTGDASPRPVGRRRARQLLTAVLLGLLAFTVTVQLGQDEADSYQNLRSVELVELLKTLDATNGRLSDQIEDLTATRDDLRSSTNASETAQKEAQRRLDDLSILAGTVGATGPGVRLTLSDPGDTVGASLLLDTVQELRDAGAEAIVINGFARVVAQTWFADDPATGDVLVSGKQVEGPYVIEAIGDPATMAPAIDFRGGIADRVESRGGTLSVERVDSITITALADVVSPEYARNVS
ncbi:MAG: DUF881 domain-containing protein [Aeromicrobium sp.]|uniref:DUF881 domain-containing protein n=1 Tax=Aeromicrobium sp. TaxID=1871063 RepID=UPI0025BB6136|nr:DUF881 domain-containing protein [Aeromicrobium sp.]MCK5890855.1 DUF881 domain-containing protein [Aeromicrobium sp.]MDF1703172.1 DUF881 domain-containing protein [Aeromicrobium sp.]